MDEAIRVAQEQSQSRGVARMAAYAEAHRKGLAELTARHEDDYAISMRDLDHLRTAKEKLREDLLELEVSLLEQTDPGRLVLCPVLPSISSSG